MKLLILLDGLRLQCDQFMHSMHLFGGETLNPHGACYPVIEPPVDRPSAPIAQALKDAHLRGVKVQVILDKSQHGEKCTSATFLARVGISVWIDASHAIAHNKVKVLDDETVVTDSFNFTKAAEQNNAENMLIMKDKALAAVCRKNWESQQAHDKKFEVKPQ